MPVRPRSLPAIDVSLFPHVSFEEITAQPAAVNKCEMKRGHTTREGWELRREKKRKKRRKTRTDNGGRERWLKITSSGERDDRRRGRVPIKLMTSTSKPSTDCS